MPRSDLKDPAVDAATFLQALDQNRKNSRADLPRIVLFLGGLHIPGNFQHVNSRFWSPINYSPSRR